MPFRFSLTELLRLREGIERNQEIMLTTAHQAVRKLEQEIKELHSALGSPPYDHTMIEGERNTGAELQFRVQCENELRRHCVQLQQRLVIAEQDRDIRAASYREARREREILDTLCEEEWQRYRCSQSRREQQEADDLYLSRMRSRSPVASDVRRYGSRSSGLPGTGSKRKH